MWAFRPDAKDARLADPDVDERDKLWSQLPIRPLLAAPLLGCSSVLGGYIKAEWISLRRTAKHGRDTHIEGVSGILPRHSWRTRGREHRMAITWPPRPPTLHAVRP